MITDDILNNAKCERDPNGILVVDIKEYGGVKESTEAWSRIYNFTPESLKADREMFFKDKLDCVVAYLKKSFQFKQGQVYLELGCGPAYIAEYLMRAYGVFFIGVDINYGGLLQLKKYLDEQGLADYVLIHGDIRNMPIKSDCADFIYGAGVIEHFTDTDIAMKESLRVLKRGGVLYNTVPPFNLFWLYRFWYSIPALPEIKELFEYIHIKLLSNRILKNKFGYELSFAQGSLVSLYKKHGLEDIKTGKFVIPPFEKYSRYGFVRKLLYWLVNNPFLCPMYFVYGKK